MAQFEPTPVGAPLFRARRDTEHLICDYFSKFSFLGQEFCPGQIVVVLRDEGKVKKLTTLLAKY
jgi:hypothetical protein